MKGTGVPENYVFQLVLIKVDYKDNTCLDSVIICIYIYIYIYGEKNIVLVLVPRVDYDK